MPWPLSQDYNEAIQNPSLSFSDPELRQSEAVCNALGLPIPCSGNFADVYAVVAGQRKWAVKCFTRQIPGLQERYVQISKYLKQVQLPFMVAFQFLEQGIRVRGIWYPVVKMEWVEGMTLNSFVRDNLDKPQMLLTLSQVWLRLAAQLTEANLAHGDLQHGNVLLVPGSRAGSVGLRLVDYDGMCVPALEYLKSTEVGHPAYQHPERLREGTYGLQIDRFSHLVIVTALRALAVGGRSIWDRFDTGDNLLFMSRDFEAPGHSALFNELRRLNDPEVARMAQALAQAAQAPVAQVPPLPAPPASEPASRAAPRPTAAPPSRTTSMPPTTVPLLVRVLQELSLLEPSQFAETEHSLAPRFNDPKLLARELMTRSWLTAFQVNQIFRGKGHELVLGSCALQGLVNESGPLATFQARHRARGPCVVRLLRRERVTDSELAQRFVREGRAAAGLNDPNLANVFDAGTTDGGFFLASEICAGKTLAEVTIALGAVPLSQAIGSLVQAAMGLQRAADVGALHRDVKPHKLLLSTTGPLKVLDLGLALLTACGRDLQSAEAFIGTPLYMAPELAATPLQADTRADVYSLGCTLFHLLTGWPPFMGVTSMQVIQSHRQEAPPDLADIVPNCPPALAAAFRRLMAKRPRERFGSPGEVAAALAPFAK